VSRTADGCIQGEARVTRTGILVYKAADGSLLRELRHPDDVFKKESLDTLKMIPITRGHPTSNGGLVSVETAKALSVGFTGETVVPDGQFVVSSVKISTADGVEAVKSGLDELSLGYTFEMDTTPGIYDGQQYDCRQRNIVYNHLALVQKGRAGVDVRLNMDAAIEVVDGDKTSFKRRAEMLVKIALDGGLEYEVPQEVKVHMAGLLTRLDSLSAEILGHKKNVEKLTAERDTAADLLAKERAKNNDEAISQLVSQRVAIEKIANDFLDTTDLANLPKMSVIDIKKAVIKSKFPSLALDGKSNDYVDARFDGTVEAFGKNESMQVQRQHTQHDSSTGQSGGTAESARKKMMERAQGAYKGHAK
jgi:hypothetical protein